MLLAACARPVAPAALPTAAQWQTVSASAPEIQPLLDALTRRDPPHRVRARFAIRMRSEPMKLAASTGGGVLMDRPGKGYMAILGPLGNPLVTLASDGVGVAMTNRTDDTFIVQADAEAGLRSLSGGALGLDDMWAVIVADLPVGARPPDAIRRSGPLVEFDYGVAEGAIVRVIADVRTHLPEALVILRGESELGRISWSEFMPSPGGPMPGKAVIEVHNVALRVDLDFKAWEAMVEVPEGLMSVVPPEGFTVTTFAEGFENMRGLDLPQE